MVAVREDLEKYVLDATRKLGGEIRFVPGARVAATAIRLARAEGVDFQAALVNLGRRFGDLARDLVSRNKLRIIERTGSDFLLGFAEAKEPVVAVASQAGYNKIRKDFFDAFSRAGRPEHYYLIDKDRIVTPENRTDGSVLVPSPAYEHVWDIRIRFAAQIPDISMRSIFNDAATKPNRSFRTFADLVRLYDLESEWLTHQHNELSADISRWAEKFHPASRRLVCPV